MDSDRNYARFYTLLKKLPGADKEELVWQFTQGRTKSLRQTTAEEYRLMCDRMAQVVMSDDRREALRRALRKQRSVCLKLMQQLGIDTTDWNRVDSFCQDPRISGQRFAWLSGEELEALERKLRAIKRKGGLQHEKGTEKSGESSCPTTRIYIFNTNKPAEA